MRRKARAWRSDVLLAERQAEEGVYKFENSEYNNH